MDGFLRRGTAYRFEGCGKVTLVDHARTALDLAGDAARDHWLERLNGVDEDYFSAVVARIPIMSDVARRFAVNVLSSNRRRLLHD